MNRRQFVQRGALTAVAVGLPFSWVTKSDAGGLVLTKHVAHSFRSVRRLFPRYVASPGFREVQQRLTHQQIAYQMCAGFLGTQRPSPAQVLKTAALARKKGWVRAARALTKMGDFQRCGMPRGHERVQYLRGANHSESHVATALQRMTQIERTWLAFFGRRDPWGPATAAYCGATLQALTNIGSSRRLRPGLARISRASWFGLGLTQASAEVEYYDPSSIHPAEYYNTPPPVTPSDPAADEASALAAAQMGLAAEIANAIPTIDTTNALAVAAAIGAAIVSMNIGVTAVSTGVTMITQGLAAQTIAVGVVSTIGGVTITLTGMGMVVLGVVAVAIVINSLRSPHTPTTPAPATPAPSPTAPATPTPAVAPTPTPEATPPEPTTVPEGPPPGAVLQLDLTIAPRANDPEAEADPDADPDTDSDPDTDADADADAAAAADEGAPAGQPDGAPAGAPAGDAPGAPGEASDGE